VAIEDAIRQVISWERKNPPAEALLSQFDDAADNTVVPGGGRKDVVL
jgi:hypothetical protein